jgi:hypothetical protein
MCILILRAGPGADGGPAGQGEKLVVIILFCFAGRFIGIPHALNGNLVNVQPALKIPPLRIDHLQFALQRIFRLLQPEISVA